MERDHDITTCSASFCPSFSSYSCHGLAETADRVGREAAGESGDCRWEENRVDNCGGNDDEEFEFVNLQTDPDAEAVVNDRVFFPVFDRNLISDSYGVGSDCVNREDSATTITIPLRDLFLRDREDPPNHRSLSSSDDDDDDELEGVPSEIYCPWTPARSTAKMSPSGGCRKSNSTGSSSTSNWSVKRWRIRDLLKRSQSEGKQSLVFLNSNSINREMKKEKRSPHEMLYLRNKAIKEEEKRKSYLPYKQDLVGLFTNIGGYAKTFPPF